MTTSSEPAGVEPHEKIVRFFYACRRSLLLLAGLLVGATAVYLVTAPQILAHLRHHLDQELAFYTVAEPFLAHVKLALFAAVLTLMPLFLAVLWQAMATPFGLPRSARLAAIVSTTLLFYIGAFFCYQVTLPYGITFLLGFGSETLQPLISVDRFVGFVVLFIIGFGVIFQLPVFMVAAARVGLYSRARFQAARRYAVLIIAIVAALLTPTPDVVNMALMGLPLYLLYEAGILIMGLAGIP